MACFFFFYQAYSRLLAWVIKFHFFFYSFSSCGSDFRPVARLLPVSSVVYSVYF